MHCPNLFIGFFKGQVRYAAHTTYGGVREHMQRIRTKYYRYCTLPIRLYKVNILSLHSHFGTVYSCVQQYDSTDTNNGKTGMHALAATGCHWLHVTDGSDG